MWLRSESTKAYTWRDHRQRSFDDSDFRLRFWLVTGVTLIGGIVTMILLPAILYGDNRSVAHSYQILVEDFNQSGLTSEDRQLAARGMLVLVESNSTVAEDYVGRDPANRQELVRALQASALTGSPLALPADSNEASWLWSFAMLWLVTYAMLLSLVLFMTYAVECRRRYEYLADLPWRKPWVWLFVLITPFGWPFYIVSARNVRKERARLALKKSERVGERP